MKINSRILIVLLLTVVTTGTTTLLVACSKPNSAPHYDETSSLSHLIEDDYEDFYPEAVDPSELPSLDHFTLPKVTGTQIELSLSFIPKDLISIQEEQAVSIFSFTNFNKILDRIESNTDKPDRDNLPIYSILAPDFLKNRVMKPIQPIDDPTNWSWMIIDRQSGGTWFAGDLELGEHLLPGMGNYNYSQERLSNSIMTAFISTDSNNAIYGKLVVPFAPSIGYFNNSELTLEQADASGVLIRNDGIENLAETHQMKEILPFVGDTENASFIKSNGTLENVISMFGLPKEIDGQLSPILEKLDGLGRNNSLDWIVFSHHPEEEYPVRIILRYGDNDHAIADMMGLKYIEERNIVNFEGPSFGPLPANALSMERFSVYKNIGVVECTFDLYTPEHLPKEMINQNYRLAELLTEMYTKGIFPQLLKNN